MNKTGDALMCVLPSNTVLVTVPGYQGRIRTTKQDTKGKRGYRYYLRVRCVSLQYCTVYKIKRGTNHGNEQHAGKQGLTPPKREG